MNELIATVFSKETGLPTRIWTGDPPSAASTGAAGTVPGIPSVSVDEHGSLELQKEQRKLWLTQDSESDAARRATAGDRAREIVKRITS